MVSDAEPGANMAATAAATAGQDAAGLAEKPAPNHGPSDHHPSGKESFGLFLQIVRAIAVSFYFSSLCIV